MANIKIAVINESSVVQDSDASQAVNDLQIQVHEHFAPIWGVDADLTFYSSGSQIPNGMWQLVILDNSDQAGALGYHDLTPDGRPLGKIFAGTDIQYGSSWTVTASHELLEMLGDPDINLSAMDQQTNSLKFYAYEVCDACEADQYGYMINNTLVSDFVYPEWFEPSRVAGQFDYCGKIQTPLTLLGGGYISVFDTADVTGWQQITQDRKPSEYHNRAKLGSRREKRRTPRDQWLKSIVKTSK